MVRRLGLLRPLGRLFVGFFPGIAFAQDGIQAGDTAWLLTATALVLFMTLPGLAAFYGGLVRQKNVLSVLMQCFAICCVVSVLWVLGASALIVAVSAPIAMRLYHQER